MKKCLFLFLLFIVPGIANAQCLVNSIVINTGYNPVSADTITTGSHDPKWQVTSITYACRTMCGCVPTFQAWAVPPLIDGSFSWATNPASQWISFLDSTGYPTTDTPIYSMTLSRELRTCVADSFVLHFQISNDNYADIDIDGSTPFFTQTHVFTLTNFTTFTSVSATVYLTPGTHYINAAIGNVPAAIPNNAHGLNIVGTLASASGTNSIVKESDTACNSYVCGTTTSCNSLTMADSVTACMNTTITLAATVVGSDSVVDIHWTPHAGLSDTSILNPTLNVGTTSGWYDLTIHSLNPYNLVFNGDFSLGDTGFSSSYVYSAPPSTILYEGHYSVYTDPHGVHSGFTSFGDHTTGTGNMLIVNGGPTASDIWCETITVTPYTNYDFSAWVADCSSSTTGTEVPIMQFKINGVLIGTPDTITASVGTWVNFRSVWNSGSSTTANICIYDACTTAGGNDFVIDDISFEQICTASDSTYVNVIPIDTTRNVFDSVSCSSSGSIALNAPSGYSTYRWSTGSTTGSISVATPGSYWLVAAGTCSELVDTFHVTFITPPTVNLGDDTGFCIGNSITLTASEPVADTLLWSNGSHGNSINVSSTGTYWLQVNNGCSVTDSIHITVFPVPPVDLGPDTTNCDGAAITLQSSDTYALPVYLWSNGNTTPAITVTTSGTYWLQVANGGCPGADTINVHIFYDTFTVYNRDTAICKGQVVQALTTNDPGATYQWLPTAGIAFSTTADPLITPDTSAMYTLSVHMPGCPVKKDSFYIDVQPNPSVYIGGNRFICLYDTIHIHANVNPAWYSGYIYSWTPTVSLDNYNSANVVFTAGATATYYVEVSTTAGCVGRDSAELIVEPGNFGTLSPDQYICPNDSVQLIANGGGTYHWYPSYYLSDSLSAAPWAHIIATQIYTVIVTSAVGCHDTLNVKLTVWPNGVIYLADSATIYPGESYQLDAQGNCTSFAWFPPSGLNNPDISNPVANPGVDTKYIVTGTTENGCKTVDSISLIVDASTLLTVPNAFTPGSNINGQLFILKRGLATLNYFRIFNRWGNLVFETTNIDEGWDGSFNGKPQPYDVYVYEIQAVTNTGTIFNKHGNVTLLR